MWRWWELRGIGIGIPQTKSLVVTIIWRSHEDGHLITGIQGCRTCSWAECPGRWNWFGEHPTRLLPHLLSGIAGTANTKQSNHFLCFSHLLRARNTELLPFSIIGFFPLQEILNLEFLDPCRHMYSLGGPWIPWISYVYIFLQREPIPFKYFIWICNF